MSSGWNVFYFVILPVILVLVFLTRVTRRNGWAMLAFLGAIAFGFGTAVLYAFYGFISGEWAVDLLKAAQPVLTSSEGIWLSAWALLAITVLFTLTPTRKPLPAAPPTVTQAQELATAAAASSLSNRPTSPLKPVVAPAASQATEEAAPKESEHPLSVLDSLRKADMITAEEYERERQRLLSEL